MTYLQSEKSPYLLQHIDNPVDWYPWGDAAFARARDENKLIFLSIGYSTCHWCHVMAHESFEDDEVAALLNQDFISIKVDREERPDIDHVYMEVCQRITGSGGWPLTVIMTPDTKPFYAATYIPKDGGQGRPGMMNLLPWLAEKWRSEPELLSNSAQEVVALLKRDTGSDSSQSLDPALFVAAENTLRKTFDKKYGGFSRAPKFPRPHDLTFLTSRYRVAGVADCLAMAEQTLLRMRCGGIYDQLGYGFHRYSTDEEWLVPHFEKMLYDQAGLIHAFLAVWRETHDEFYAETVRETITYLLRDMQSPEGAFYSAEDADSEGVEGKFYLWTEGDISRSLGENSFCFIGPYNISPSGNYHDEMTGRLTGNNILHLSSENTAEAYEHNERFAKEREILFQVREGRIRPHLDDKIITAWNGMLLSALAEAGRLLDDDEYIEQARGLAEFILSRLCEDGRLYRRYRQGEAAIAGFSEDYAFMIRGLLDLYSACFDVKYLARAVELAETLKEYFLDKDSGKLYDTPTDGEELLVRPVTTFDGATPSPTSAALESFARLFLLTGDLLWHRCAEDLLHSIAGEVARYPAGYTQLLQAASWLLLPTREIVVVGDMNDPVVVEMFSVLRKLSLQQTVVLFKSTSDPDQLASIASYVSGMYVESGQTKAYVCEDFACHAPLTTAAELVAVLKTPPA